MGMIEDDDYITSEVNLLCQRLAREGMDMDMVYATLIEKAATGYANMDGAEMMPDVFRRTADEMEAGEYRLQTAVAEHPDGHPMPPRPSTRLTIIEGGGGSKV